ncbi:general secretion pathway protein GspK [Pseudorhodoferax sp. Leaf267]|nr:general secretion pathway protein GspK [Pseudorhodoferax sp. Leaf267]
MAMLTVTLVATFAATALWQQWRAVEIETAERARVQSSWVLVGALDWARLILREDARASTTDHLAEPWAVPLQESRLSTFLAADRGVASGDEDDLPEVFLSGRIIDLQSRLNLTGLVSDKGELIEKPMAAFTRLFELLGLPPQDLQNLAENLRRAHLPNVQDGDVPLRPQRFDQLAWLGVSPALMQALEPYVTVLPEATPVNLNTASAPVIAASIPGLDLAGAARLVDVRTHSQLRSVADAAKVLDQAEGLDAAGFSVQTQFFEVQGRLRVERSVVNERSLVKRAGSVVTTVWRERAPGELLQ